MSFVVPRPRISKWQRLARTPVATFPVFQVERLRIQAPSWSEPRDFFSLGCSDWCNVISITENDEIVFVWQYRFGIDDLSLELPGGILDPGEEPVEAARRELLEETGYAAHHVEPFLSVAANPALQPNRCHTFVARGARKESKPEFDEAEECEVALVPRRHLGALLDAGAVTHALMVCALEAFLRRFPA